MLLRLIVRIVANESYKNTKVMGILMKWYKSSIFVRIGYVIYNSKWAFNLGNLAIGYSIELVVNGNLEIANNAYRW
jgi:hypothetical protein